eukprot:jgi/Astpho2/5221/fgenesh1_pm.00074_%23_12_t
MRAVLQRVKSASVTVDGSVVSSIGPGLVALIGIHQEDTEKDADYLVQRLLNVKLWPGEDNKGWKSSVQQKGFGLLCVSQFTLHNSSRGNRPDFHTAMPGNQAKNFYAQFLDQLKAAYVPEKVHDGVFAAMMDVALVNDGPVTIVLDSNKAHTQG